MAFDRTKLTKVFEGFYRYQTADDVTAANYFRDAFQQLKVADVILVQANDGSVTGLTGITAVTKKTPQANASVSVSALS